MFRSTAIILAAVAYGANAAVVPLEPSGNSVFAAGSACTMQWTPDTTGVWTTMNIELMTGDNFNQVHLKTVGTVDGTDATNATYSYTCPAVTPNSKIYFYKFTSPASTDVLFTTRFLITDAAGASTPPTQTETATTGELVGWGTGALVDPSQGDAPPAAGTGTGNTTTAAPSSGSTTTGAGSSTTSVRTSSATGTSTATTASRTNAASQSYALSSIALGAFGALTALFL